MNALDLFAGPGGWDVALHALGIEPLGVEWDDAAVSTRAAAGLWTKQADVSALDPLDFAPCELLLGSPPCPTFSAAGKGDGIADMPLVYEAATAVARSKPVPPLPWRDERSALVVEPLRWAVFLKPRFLAWEQVPSVLPFWEHCAEILRMQGWNVWTGVMEAERYGVPQTRKRAILMADREQPVHPPRPTHQRYVKGEPQRHEVTMEGEILPWVSMAGALGWVEGVEPSPAPTVSGGGTGSGGGVEVFAGADSRKRVLEANQRNGSTGEYGERGEDEPAFTVTTNADRWKFRNGNQANAALRDPKEPAPTIHFGKACNDVSWVNEHGNPEKLAECGCFIGWVDRGGYCACCQAHLNDPDGLYAIQGNGTHGYANCPSNRPIAYDRRQQNPDGSPVPPVPLSEPAPTLTANGLARSTHQWVVATHANTRKSEGGNRYRPNGAEIDAGARPSLTVDSTVGHWTRERPATNVNGDPRTSRPGRHDPEESGSQQKDAIRVTEEEALILQSFPADYPVQGNKSQRFQQIGNAVPPLLAHAILSALLAPVLEQRTELAA